MIKDRIAIPSAKSLKRPKRKARELPDVPVILENVRSPAEIKRDRRIKQRQARNARREAAVAPCPTPHSMVAARANARLLGW